MLFQYDASSKSKIGGGGEYEIQIGFGWTNGVVLDFLTTYNGRLNSKDKSGTPDPVVREP